MAAMVRDRRFAWVMVVVVGLVLAMLVPPLPLARAASGSTFTTFFTGSGQDNESAYCKQKQEVNCNHYAGKKYVVINGGPSGALLQPGTYFFAVLAPGGQHSPNGEYDATTNPKVLSTDPVSNRTFTVDGAGVLTYSGTHENRLVSSGKGKNATTERRIRLGLESTGWFQDTPNSGGTYIAAICHVAAAGDPGRPHNCKYDAFKVNQIDGTVFVQGHLEGYKYHDTNVDGARITDVTPDDGISGWLIDVYTLAGFEALPQEAPVETVVTDSNGHWSFNSPPVIEGTLGNQDYVVCERDESDWVQTGAIEVGTEASGPDSVVGAYSADTTCYVVSFAVGAAGTGASNINFGNVAQATLSGSKYFDDGTTPGLRDGTGPAWDEVGLEGWQILLEMDVDGNWVTIDTLVTDVDGNFSTVVEPGHTYRVSEVATSVSGWSQTGNTVDQTVSTPAVDGPTVVLSGKQYVVTIPVTAVTESDGDMPSVEDLFFGNLCSVSYQVFGKTKGYWQNKAGNQLAKAKQSALAALNLRKEGGGNYDPQSTDFTWTNQGNNWTYWLSAANAKNMAFMLSAQMAATWLNVEYGITDGTAVVDGKSINDWLAEANTMLGSYGYVVQSGPTRATMNSLMTRFDRINNGLIAGTTYDQTACGDPYPAP
jgi:hypothetical protein